MTIRRHAETESVTGNDMLLGETPASSTRAELAGQSQAYDSERRVSRITRIHGPT